MGLEEEAAAGGDRGDVQCGKARRLEGVNVVLLCSGCLVALPQGEMFSCGIALCCVCVCVYSRCVHVRSRVVFIFLITSMFTSVSRNYG